MLTELEKKIIASIQEDIAVTDRPYLDIATKLGIAEETLLDSLQSLCSRGFIRRFGATLRHQKTGFTANAMAALFACSPYVNADQFRQSALMDNLKSLIEEVPVRELQFNLDGSVWDLI